MDLVTAIPWADVSWSAIVVLVVVLIIRGDLVPRKTYDGMVADRDQWRAVSIQLLETTGRTVVAAETAAEALEKLPPATKEAGR